MTESTFEQWAFQQDGRFEWVDGKVIVMAPASRKHVQLTGWIQSLLLIVVQQQQLGEVLGPEFMVRLRKGVKSRRVPDVLFVSSARKSLLKPTYLDGAPDLAVEVVSPDSVARDWREKFLAYEAAGVREYWVIDPLSRQMEVYVLKRKKFQVVASGKDGSVESTVVPHFRLNPNWLWDDALPSVLDTLRNLGLTP
jgi:Uma2 family endonuclease